MSQPLDRPDPRDRGPCLAPTLPELLTHHGVPTRHHRAARAAILDWLTSWHGATPTNADAEAELDHLWRMASLGR
jgi:hypothetical protein